MPVPHVARVLFAASACIAIVSIHGGCGTREPGNKKVNFETAKQIVRGIPRQQVEELLGPGKILPADDELVVKLGSQAQNKVSSWQWVIWTLDPGAETNQHILVAFDLDGKVAFRNHAYISKARPD